MRELFKTIVVCSVLVSALTVSSNARDGHNNRGKLNQYSFTQTERQLSRKSSQEEYQEYNNSPMATRRLSLGASARSGIASSPGFTVDRTWMDDQFRPSHVGRTVDWNQTPDIHFGYTDASTSGSNPSYGYNVYDPVGGSWPQGAEVGCEVQTADAIGQWVNIDVTPNGFVFLAGNDDISGSLDNHMYFQGSQFSCFFGGGSIIPPSIYNPHEFLPPFSPSFLLQRPVVEIQTWAGDTITHLLAGQDQPILQGANLVLGRPLYFRKFGSGVLGAWNGPMTVDTTAFTLVGSMTASRVSPKVAISYCRQAELGVANEAINNGFDVEVYYRVSDSIGASGTWTPPINLTNYGAHTVANHIAFIQTHALYDSEDGLHVVWDGYPVPENVYDSVSFFWGDFSNSVFHWSDRTDNISRVHNAEWGLAVNSQVCGWGSPGVGYTAFQNISECNGRMYCTFVQYLDFFGNSGTSQIDDCASGGFDSRFHAANGEIYLSVSTGLDGLLWDAARNLTNTYTPGCDSAIAFGGNGVCMNDTRVTVSRYGMDEAAMAASFGELSWPPSTLVDPSGSYTGDYYLHAFYLEDHFPSPAWRNNAWGPLTENPLNWMRLACIDPITAPQISISPNSAGYPQQVDFGLEEVITVTITNDGNTALNISQIIGVETAGPAGWLGVSASSLTVPAGASNTTTLDITIKPFSPGPGAIFALSGEVYMLSDAPAPRDSVSFQIVNFIVGPVADLVLDSVSNNAIRLVITSNGEMGNGGVGGANMDYVASGLECDQAQNVYLFNGSPLIIQKVDSAAGIFKLSTNLFAGGFAPSYAFKPVIGQASPGSFVGPAGSDALNTGTFVNWDSSIAIEQTFYAPTGNGNFVLVKTQYFSNDGLDHANLLIGDVIDWDTPSDPGAFNTAGILGKTVYLQGVDTSNVDTTCTPKIRRFSASTFLGFYDNTEFNNDNCANNSDLHGVYASNNSGSNPAAAGAPNGALDSALVWNEGGSLTGQRTLEDTALDQRITQTYVHDYTLGATDTLTVYTALVTVLNGTTADLDSNVAQALDWYAINLRNGCNVGGCCDGTVGNVDGDGGVDIADLTFLIDHLFINFPELPCDSEGNVDGEGGIDIGDLTFLIDHLFINFPLLPACP